MFAVRSRPCQHAHPRQSRSPSRISGFVYAIRNIVAEARKVEAAGTTVRYLNIGDPIAFGFKTPPHLIEAVERAMRDGHNGYAPSAGILPAREAVADECARRGMPVSRRSRGHHGRHVGRDRAGADRAGRSGRRSAGAGADLSALHGGAREDRRARRVLPDRSGARLAAGPRSHPQPRSRPRRARWWSIDPNNPTGAIYPRDVRRALVELADAHGLPLLADEVYGDLAFDGPVAGDRARIDPDAPIISFSWLSKAYLAPAGAPAGWRSAAPSGWTTCSAAVKKLADGRLCAPGRCSTRSPRRSNGDRSHQVALPRTRCASARA